MRRLVRFVACGLVLASAIAGCGDASRDFSPTVLTHGPAPTGTPIKIGLIYTATGGFEVFRPAKTVADGWADWINLEQGGVNGHPVEIVAIDDKGSGDAATAAGRQLVEQDKVQAVIYESPVAGALLTPYFEQNGIPVIGGNSADLEVTKTGEGVFAASTQGLVSRIGPMLVSQAVGLKSIAEVVCSETPSCELVGEEMRQQAARAGVEYLGTVKVGEADPSLIGPCLQLAEWNPETLGLSTSITLAKRLIPECRLQGYQGKYIVYSHTANDVDIPKLRVEPVLLQVSGFPWWADAEPVAQFRDVLHRYTGDVTLGVTATTTWTALELFRKAMSTGPAAEVPVQALDVLASFKRIKNETLDGLLSQPVDFTGSAPYASMNCFWVAQYSNHKYTVIPPRGDSGNGATGDLASTCYQPQ